MKATVLVVAALLMASSASAQSLGELAKRTAADREKSKDKATKVYTDEDLKKLPPVPGDTAAPAPPITFPPPPAPTPTSPAVQETQGRAADTRKDEAYWQARMRSLTTQLDTDVIAHGAASRRVAEYERQMLNSQRSINGEIYVDRITKGFLLAAQDEQSRLAAAVGADRAAIRALEEEARKAAVPPGWLRR